MLFITVYTFFYFLHFNVFPTFLNKISTTFFTPMTAMLPVGGAVGAAVLTAAPVVSAAEVTAAVVAAGVVGAADVAAVTQANTQRKMLSSDYAVLCSKSMRIPINISLKFVTL